VDYWDRLGWKDPFGAKAHTERQKAYVPHLGTRGLVTPQLLLENGKLTRGWAEKLKKAAARKAKVRIDADLAVKDGKLRATVRLSPDDEALPDGAVVRAVLFQREAVTEVPRGENEGKTLLEYQVVRALHDPLPAAKALEKKGVNATLALPEKVARANLGLAVLVENPSKMKTIESGVFDLPEKKREK